MGRTGTCPFREENISHTLLNSTKVPLNQSVVAGNFGCVLCRRTRLCPPFTRNTRVSHRMLRCEGFLVPCKRVCKGPDACCPEGPMGYHGLQWCQECDTSMSHIYVSHIYGVPGRLWQLSCVLHGCHTDVTLAELRAVTRVSRLSHRCHSWQRCKSSDSVLRAVWTPRPWGVHMGCAHGSEAPCCRRGL